MVAAATAAVVMVLEVVVVVVALGATTVVAIVVATTVVYTNHRRNVKMKSMRYTRVRGTPAFDTPWVRVKYLLDYLRRTAVRRTTRLTNHIVTWYTGRFVVGLRTSASA